MNSKVELTFISTLDDVQSLAKILEAFKSGLRGGARKTKENRTRTFCG